MPWCTPTGIGTECHACESVQYTISGMTIYVVHIQSKYSTFFSWKLPSWQCWHKAFRYSICTVYNVILKFVWPGSQVSPLGLWILMWWIATARVCQTHRQWGWCVQLFAWHMVQPEGSPKAYSVWKEHAQSTVGVFSRHLFTLLIYTLCTVSLIN